MNELGNISGISIGVSGYKGFRKALKTNANLDDTLERMKLIAVRDFKQVKELAFGLQGNTVEETSENIWNWLRANTKYKLDTNGIEELRTPARSLVDGKLGLSNPEFGIDCDDYTILVSALLLNLGIDHEYRVAAYEQKGKFQHIYPVAFDEYGNEFIIDPVPEIPFFNYEAEPIIDLKTVKMELHELSGLGSATDEAVAEFQQDLNKSLNEEFTLSGIENEEDDIYFDTQFLSGFVEVHNREDADVVLSGADIPNLLRSGVLAEVNKAKQLLVREKQTPTVLSKAINVDKELSIMNELIEVWGDEDERVEVLEDAIENGGAYQNFYKAILLSLEELEKEEESGLSGIEDEEIFLAKVGPQTLDLSDMLMSDQLGFFKKLWGKVKKTASKVASKVKSVTKKVIKAVVKYNPVSILLKSATLLILKLNMFGFAEKIFYGYLSEGHAKKNGLNMNEWKKAVGMRKKLEKWYGKIGDIPTFKRAVVKGRAAKKVKIGLGELGEPVTAATATASGSAFIILAKKVLSALDLRKMFSGKKSDDSSSPSRAASPASIPSAAAFSSDDGSSDFAPQARMADNFSITDPLVPESEEKKGMMQKIKDLWAKHKKKIIIVGIGGVAAIVGLIIWKKVKEKKKRSLAGVKAARTRARNRKKYATPSRSRSTSRKKNTTLKGSTTILRVPTKSVSKTRVTRRSNASRLKAMHKKAKQLQKQHPNTKYSTLLKKASKQI